MNFESTVARRAGLMACAVMIHGAPVLAQGQQPIEEQRAIANAVAQERSAHLSSLSDRSVQLSAEVAVLRLQVAKLEAAAKDCKPAAEPKK